MPYRGALLPALPGPAGTRFIERRRRVVRTQKASKVYACPQPSRVNRKLTGEAAVFTRPGAHPARHVGSGASSIVCRGWGR